MPVRELAGYCIGAVGSNVVYALVATYLLVFYTESFGLKVAAVGTLLLVVRIWDSVLDVLMGILVDNTRTRWGKFRPYLLFGGVLTGVSAAACFFAPNFSAAGKLVYAYCTYVTWSMSYTICDIPFWSLTAAMTEDPVERTRVVSISRTGAQFGYWIVLVGALPAVKFFGGSWTMVGVLAGIVCSVCFLVAFAQVREHCVAPRRQLQTPRSAIRFFAANRPLRSLLLVCLFLEIVSNIRGVFTFYFFKYYLGRADLIPLAMAAYITPVIAGCIAAPFFARRVGKVRTVVYCYLLAGAAMISMYGIAHHLPALFALTVVAGFLDGVGNIARNSCLADCVEFGEWKTGHRAEGLVFAANIVKTKVAAGLAGAIPAYLLALIGYLPNTSQSEATQTWIALFFTIILGGASMAAVLPLLGYELSEDRYAQVLAALNERKTVRAPVAVAG